MSPDSICLVDWETKDNNVVIMDLDHGSHFLWLEKDIKYQLEWCMDHLDELSDIQMKSYNHALECFVYGKLNFEERLIRAYLINPEACIRNYTDLVRLEKDLDLPF